MPQIRQPPRQTPTRMLRQAMQTRRCRMFNSDYGHWYVARDVMCARAPRVGLCGHVCWLALAVARRTAGMATWLGV